MNAAKRGNETRRSTSGSHLTVTVVLIGEQMERARDIERKGFLNARKPRISLIRGQTRW